MAVPSSGSLSMLGIFSEKNEDDYGAANIDGENSISLRGLSSDSHDDTGSGGNINNNSDGWLSDDNTSNPAQDGSNIQSAPFSMKEFYGYDHDHVAEVTLHSTSFQPQFAEHQFPYQPKYYFSGYRGAKGNYPGTTNFGTINSEGSFSVGGKTGVAIGQFYNYNINASTSTGTRIQLLFSATSTSNFANSGWTKLEVYANSSGSGSPLLTLNRADAQFTATGANGTHNRKARYEWPSSGHNGSLAFSTHFGTDTTASNNTTHFIKIIQ